ncbi:hypothetical protein BP5796_07740 [Coleophoma crateriformis]|uniref:2EXR domain-containing protein n=1 Tax=Coleophoma crateriformis TaxID=565419 RepID=A0A3D8RCM9_9HELO|nr:hypothetical protein BP5796_07740 [Coleophoma crateriformis]
MASTIEQLRRSLSLEQHAKTKFSTLPAEILNIIWDEILPSRIVDISLSPIAPSKLGAPTPLFGLTSACPLPPAAYTCHEFLHMALAHYMQSFSYTQSLASGRYLESGRIFFNPRKDVLYFPETATRAQFPKSDTFLCLLPHMSASELAHIQHVAFQTDYEQRDSIIGSEGDFRFDGLETWIADVVSFFPSLETLTVVVDEYDPERYTHLIPKEDEVMEDIECRTRTFSGRLSHVSQALQVYSNVHSEIYKDEAPPPATPQSICGFDLSVHILEEKRQQSIAAGRIWKMPEIRYQVMISKGLNDYVERLERNYLKTVKDNWLRREYSRYLDGLRVIENQYQRATVKHAIEEGLVTSRKWVQKRS